MIRPLRSSDLPRIREMHAAAGIDWELPSFSEPEMVGAFVYVDENDTPVMLLGGRKAVEVFLIADRSWETPGQRNGAFAGLYRMLETSLYRAGFREAVCWMPTHLEKSFGRRLSRWGWTRSKWNVFVARINP